MSERSVNVDCGGGVLVPLLTVLFVGLKLTGYIDWSWWWVLSPIWISFAIGLLGLLIFLPFFLRR